MTRQQMVDKIKELGGIIVREKDGEIKVKYRGGNDETAYYTNSREDAVATAIAMRLRQQGLSVE